MPVPIKIAVTADLHWGHKKKGDESTLQMVRDLQKEAPDVIVLAGDLGGGGPESVRECLDLFAGIDARRLFIAGNHDLWTQDGDSEEILRETLPRIGREHGFHYLEGDPVVIDGVGIAGTVGWYDYSFRDERLGIDLVHYERKYLRRVGSWNDRRFIRWGHTDREFTDLLASELRAALEGLSVKAAEIVAITHHLPFEELVVRTPQRRTWAFANAFLGSGKIGEVLLEFPQVRHHFCGHSHVPNSVRKGPIRSINVGSNYMRKRYEILELG